MLRGLVASEIWKVAIEALRANRMRAVLTMLGVMIGAACLVLVVTVALTGKQYIIAQIEGVGSNIVYAELVRTGPSEATPLGDHITMGDLEAVAALPEVSEAAGTRSFSTFVVQEGKELPVSLVGVTEGFQRIRNLEILRGRFLDADDMMLRTKVGVLSEQLAQEVFQGEDPVGKLIRVADLQFTVVGVFRERVSTFGQSEIQEKTVIIPFPLMKYYTGDEWISVLYAQAVDPQEVFRATTRVEEVLNNRHRAGAAYRVQNLTSLLEAAGRISLALTIVLLIIGFIALLISGIGIMNIMLVTVTERTREIGLRKAVGAPRRQILYQFLFEAFLISSVGAVIGILIALSIPVLVRPFLPGNLTPPISWISVVLAFVVTCSVGVLFGYLPADRASQLQPADTLRWE